MHDDPSMHDVPRPSEDRTNKPYCPCNGQCHTSKSPCSISCIEHQDANVISIRRSANRRTEGFRTFKIILHEDVADDLFVSNDRIIVPYQFGLLHLNHFRVSPLAFFIAIDPSNHDHLDQMVEIRTIPGIQIEDVTGTAWHL